MMICKAILSSLVPIGLVFNIAGSLVLIGYRLPVLRPLGFRLSPTHRKRVSALTRLWEDEEVHASDKGFTELRKTLYKDKFMESVKIHGGELNYNKFARDDDVIILHVEEVGEDVPSAFEETKLKRDLSEAGDSVNREIEQRFLCAGVLLLLAGFILQFAASF